MCTINECEKHIFICNLRWLMEERSLTEAEMAAVMHLSPGLLRRLLAGEPSRRVSVRVLFYLSEHFGYEINELFTPLWQIRR